MAFFLYASFPNSRQRNRNPTTKAVTYQITLNNLTEPLVRVAEANLNRTYLILKNLNEDFNFWYIYATTTAVLNPSVTPTFGVKYQIIYNTTSNIIYEKQSDGTGIDWLPVLIQDVGERVDAFQSANLDSLEDVYCCADTTSPIIPPQVAVVVDIDSGRN